MDVEKTIEFILEQQTRFEAGMQALSASQQETDRRLRSTERLIRRLARLGAAQLEAHDQRLEARGSAGSDGAAPGGGPPGISGFPEAF